MAKMDLVNNPVRRKRTIQSKGTSFGRIIKTRKFAGLVHQYHATKGWRVYRAA